METIRVAGAQINLRVGDLAHNEARIRDAMSWAEAEGADVLLLPELAIPGYPPEDLVIRRGFVDANLGVLDELAGHAGSTVTVVGVVSRVRPGGSATDGRDSFPVANAAALLHQGQIRGIYNKVLLPNYGVFDEQRYFVAGSVPGAVWNVGGVAVGVSICEDIWVPDGPPSAQVAAGAQVLLNINGSPFHVSKDAERVRHIEREAVNARVPVVYLNLVGGQDELVFDGGSIVMDREGSIQYRAPRFEEDLFVVDIEVGEPAGKREAATVARVEPSTLPSKLRSPSPAPAAEPIELIYRALVLGLGDYVRKNGFSKVVVGLSGGIDSALTAVIAVDALGRDSVRGVTMPSAFSSQGSIRDSEELARRLGIRLDRIAIGDLFDEYRDALEAVFASSEFGVAEENLQPRIRGTLLMGISNKHNEMVIATGNKSEMAVGYATLYGDMAGGYAVLKDVLKTTVYELADWRNRAEEVIPEETIRKPPSAELRPGQLDTDSLPPYEVLDEVLAAYIEEDRSIDAIVDAGFDRAVVTRVAAMVDRNEYKRRQAPPGVKITPKAFGRDRRLPITNGWRGG
ncbi:MAG: NAD+ synthase [Acidimicrobiia bacterium]|nr:NAD+ synthase [Acidimicrobiia bacterium]MYF83913.1 NAD+ synthase [Acidimicrobiia bacterium]